MYDVLIVGAGLAGLNCAQELLTNSRLTLAVIDKGRSLKNNPLRLTFTDTLHNFNLSDCAEAQYDSFGLISYHGARSVHHYQQPAFAAFNYNQACNKIRSGLISNGNLKIISGRATDLENTKDYIQIKLANGKTLKAKLLIDASGKLHFSRQMTKVNSPKLYTHSFGQSFENAQNENTTEAWFIAGSIPYGTGGGWYYPIGKSKASVGFALITKEKRFPAKELRQKYEQAIKEIDPLNRFLKNAAPVGYEVGTIPIEHLSQFYDDRLLVIGDAAGQATPWMCMGVEPALENSRLAAQVALQALNNSNFYSPALASFQQDWDKTNGAHFASVNQQEPKLWFMGEDVWDFVIEQDLNNLNAQNFLERVRFNKHLMPKYKALFRWVLFRLRHLFEWQKYKRYK